MGGTRTQAGHGDPSKGPKLSEDTVKQLPVPEAGNRVYYFAGDTVQGATAPRGFGVRVTAGGTRAFVLNYRVGARERRYTIGGSPDWSVLKAIRRARDLRQDIDKGEDPVAARTASRVPAPKVKTVADVLDAFAEGYLRNPETKELRTGARVERALNDVVKPEIGDEPIYQLRRSTVMAMLRKIAGERGPVAADRTLAYVRKAFAWYQIEDDDFTSPIVRGMARTSPTERIRDRRLADDEVRDLWTALDLMTGPAAFVRLVRALLLSAQRRNDIADARWDETEGDLLVIPAARYKTKIAHAVPLTPALKSVIGAKGEGAGPFIFSTTNGRRPFSGFGKAKEALDEKIAEVRKEAGRPPMPEWRLHDLRRTGRTWLTEDRFDENAAEILLGHLQAAIRRTYNTASFADEKREGLERIAARLDRILNPPPANVVPMAERRGVA